MYVKKSIRENLLSSRRISVLNWGPGLTISVKATRAHAAVVLVGGRLQEEGEMGSGRGRGEPKQIQILLSTPELPSASSCAACHMSEKV